MRFYFSLLLCNIFLSCNLGNSTEYYIENNAWKCVSSKYEVLDISIFEHFKSLEKILIATKNLKDSSSESYYEMFELVAKKNSFPLFSQKLFYDELEKLTHFPIDFNCNAFSEIDSTDLENSKIYVFIINFQKKINSATNEKINFGKLVIDNFEEKDFKHPFIKYFLTTYLIWYEKSLNSLLRQ